MKQVQTNLLSNAHNVNFIKVRLSGMLAEVQVRNSIVKPHNRNGGRKETPLEENAYVTEEELEHAEQVRLSTIRNAIRTFKRSVYANFSNGFTFLTLTFDANKCNFDITDVTTCRKKFTYFWRNVTRAKELANTSISFVYLGAIEFHQDGSVHFHVLCHIPRKYRELLKAKWHHGHLDLRRSRQNPLSVRKIANYTKKGMFDRRLDGQKHRYLWSRNLKKSLTFEFTNNGLPAWINEQNSELIFNKNYEYGFRYYQFMTTLTEDDFQAYIESADADYLQYLIEQLQMIQQDVIKSS